MKRNWHVLVVDDDVTALKMVSALLTEDGYEVCAFDNVPEALEHFKTHGADVILADLKMPEADGIDLFNMVQEIDASTPFIIMTAFGSINSAVDAVKQGVANYLIKPLNYDELMLTLENVMKQREQSFELEALKRMERERNDKAGFIGQNPEIVNIFQMVSTVAPTDAPVLIYGETGTGKELVARAIHQASLRAQKPMVCINSAALNDNLLESELFGYVKGSFTNAVGSKIGRLELADGGTLFLDEISQMSLKLQAKLLRFLQEGTFESVGSNVTKKVNVRVIAATNKNLYEAIENRQFLNALLYRLDVISLKIPPLRERPEDIPLLTDYFVKMYARKYNKKVQGADARSMELLSDYDWPGNVRQLENYIMRSVIVCKGRFINVNDLPEQLYGGKHKNAYEAEVAESDYMEPILKAGMTLKDVENEMIIKMIDYCNGNKSKAAEMLGISRRALYTKMERLGQGDKAEE